MPTKRNSRTLPKLGPRLKKWRKSQDLTLSQVDKITRATIGPLSQVENNISLPSLETIARIHKKTNPNVICWSSNEGEMLKKEK